MILIEIIINSLVASNIIFVLILLNISLLKNLFEKPIDVKYYYINNFFYTIILNYLYIIFFIVFNIYSNILLPLYNSITVIPLFKHNKFS